MSIWKRVHLFESRQLGKGRIFSFDVIEGLWMDY